MSTAVENAIQSGPVHVCRPARALIGWMRPEDAAAALAGPNPPPELPSEYVIRAARAQQAVQSRTTGIDQSDAIEGPPLELAGHISALEQNAVSAQYFNEGWAVAVADLRRVCAIQPFINIEDATKRTEAIDASDMASVAAVTLPLATPSLLAAAYNASSKTWVFSSANPNLRIAAQGSAEVSGQRIFGFSVAVSPSFVQVACYNGRYLLRDGYHRAYGLLARGLTHAPVFVRTFERFEDLHLPPGLLSQDAFLGSRPPVLPDYLDDAVSANASAIVMQKVVVIQALEVATVV
jgi:hypothetical protein